MVYFSQHSVTMSSSSSESSSGSETDSEVGAEDVWAQKQDWVMKRLLPELKRTLESWHPGIGDKIALSNFCRYVERHSSCLS